MKKSERGWSLVELVMVIVIIGILSSMAIPKFVDLTGSTQIGVMKDTMRAWTTASMDNYKVCVVHRDADNCQEILESTTCQDAYSKLMTTSTDYLEGVSIGGGTVGDGCNVKADMYDRMEGSEKDKYIVDVILKPAQLAVDNTDPGGNNTPGNGNDNGRGNDPDWVPPGRR